jgi:hypothetical protein
MTEVDRFAATRTETLRTPVIWFMSFAAALGTASIYPLQPSDRSRGRLAACFGRRYRRRPRVRTNRLPTGTGTARATRGPVRAATCTGNAIRCAGRIDGSQCHRQHAPSSWPGGYRRRRGLCCRRAIELSGRAFRRPRPARHSPGNRDRRDLDRDPGRPHWRRLAHGCDRLARNASRLCYRLRRHRSRRPSGAARRAR